jgi:hypothetical protein
VQTRRARLPFIGSREGGFFDSDLKKPPQISRR